MSERPFPMLTLPEIVGARGLLSDGDWVESKDQDSDGEIRLTQLADVGDGEFRDRSDRWMNEEQASRLNVTYLHAGDVLVARMPDPLGRACVCPPLPTRAVTVVDVCIVRAPDHNPKWLAYALNAPQSRTRIAAFQAGSTRKRISKGNLSTIPLPMPPRPVQDALVAAIETHFSRLDAAVASLTRAKANVKRARASVLQAAVEGRLVPTEAALARAEGRDYEPAPVLLDRILVERRAAWAASGARGTHQEPVKPDTAGLPGLPEGWGWASMDALAVHGFTNGLYVPKARYGGGVPILRIDDFQDDWSRGASEFRRVDIDEDASSKYGLAAGQIVMNRVNSLTHLGKSLAIEDRHLPAVFESNMMRATIHPSCRVDYLTRWLRSRVGRSLLLKDAKWAVNQASINQDDVARTPVPLPPIAEQHRIVAEVDRRLSVLDALDASLDANLARCARLRQAVLKRAFEGRLVPAEGAA